MSYRTNHQPGAQGLDLKSAPSFDLPQHGAGHVRRQCASVKRLTIRAALVDTGRVPEKKGTGFGDSIYTWRTTASRRLFFVRCTITSSMSGSGGDTFGYAGFRVYRFANPTICCSPRLATGCAVPKPHTEVTMTNSTPTPQQFPSPSTAGALSVDQLFQAAFNNTRDPRSPEYKNGVRAALSFRIEGQRIDRLYEAGTAQDDAFHAGQAEGHALWRAAVAKIGGAA